MSDIRKDRMEDAYLLDRYRRAQVELMGRASLPMYEGLVSELHRLLKRLEVKKVEPDDGEETSKESE